MVSEYAIIKDGVVINRIISSREFALEVAQSNGAEISDDPRAEIGARKQAGVFAKPPARTAALSADEKIDALLELLKEKNQINDSEISRVRTRGRKS